MKIFVATVVTLAVLAAPACAQSARGASNGPPARELREQDMKKMREQADIERQYNETVKRTRSEGPPPKTDPWSRVRPAGSADAKH